LKRSILSGHFWHDLWIAFFVLIIAVGILLGQGLVIAFGVMGLVAGAISLVWNRLALEEVSYERTLSGSRAFIGEDLQMTVTLTNRKPLPLPLPWIRVQDELSDALEVIEGDVAANVRPKVQTLEHSTSMAWYERIRWHYKFKCTQRGMHRIGPARLESGDPFGFLRNRGDELVQEIITVYPKVVPLNDLGIPAARPLGDVRQGLPIYRDPARPMDLREYRLGDPMKSVDGKATARMQELQVRTYEPSSTYNVVVAVTVDTNTPYWEAYFPDDLERVVTAAAAVASDAIERQYTVGMISNDLPVMAGKPLTVPPGRGADQMSVILTSLAAIRPYALAPMAKMLLEHSRRLPPGSTLMVCTSHMYPEFAETLNAVRARGFRIVVVYVGQDDCPPLHEGILVHDIRQYLDSLEAQGEPVAG
jgi:uncharacterized protein (DUF58 family)